MASTCTGQSPSDVAQRWSKKEKKMLNIQRPFSVKLYNQHMGGVDLMDQCVAMYPHRRKNKRWYIKVFFHFLDVTTVNAWHLTKYGSSALQGICSSCAHKCRIHQDTRKRKPSATPPRKRRAVSKAPPEIRVKAGGKPWAPPPYGPAEMIPGAAENKAAVMPGCSMVGWLSPLGRSGLVKSRLFSLLYLTLRLSFPVSVRHLVFGFEHQQVGDVSEGQTEADDLGLTDVSRELSDVDDPGRHAGASYVTFELLTVVAIGYRGQETHNSRSRQVHNRNTDDTPAVMINETQRSVFRMVSDDSLEARGGNRRAVRPPPPPPPLHSFSQPSCGLGPDFKYKTSGGHHDEAGRRPNKVHQGHAHHIRVIS
ncbi:hypothetical protein F7725_027317 [Dissostichus mawsoni]|uniref:PiggyBac transposable element-derived protein domain-containing protein n=1 Tax=Dissostichus mawsoni TaxID=36200 RepID=A0A7J5XDH5_DISMA|nr:hypothetical protein F7725_027317 [Dissostichus mawsoni]